MRLRVMTFNIRGGLGMDGRRSIERIADVVRASGPQLVGLQEVHQRLPWSRFAGQPAALARLTGLRAVYHPSFSVGVGSYGNLWLTAFPVAGSGRQRLPGGREPRAAVWAVFETPAGPVRGMVTHLGLSAEEKPPQAGELVQAATGAAEPLLLLGDLNAGPGDAEVVNLLSAGLRHAVPPETATYPADRPQFRIDYILVSRHWQVKDGRAIDSQASDHRPLVADLELTDRD